VVVAQDLRRIAEQPGPFLGGLVGTIVSCAALVGALLWLPSPAAAEPESPLVIEFIPASAVSLGELEGETGAATSEPPSEPAVDEPPSVPTSVSDNATTPNPATKPGPSVAPTPKQNPSPKPNPSPTPNPSPKPEPGGVSPFGDPDAWSDLVQDGDPWAAAVMRALRSMKVPAWAGKLTNDHPFQFRLVICKDGRIDKVLRKQSTGDANLDATLEHEISRLKLPPVPASMAASMPRSCVTLSYQFSWSAAGVG
jgi:outer membrane biosynthesis protein TonB